MKRLNRLFITFFVLIFVLFLIGYTRHKYYEQAKYNSEHLLEKYPEFYEAIDMGKIECSNLDILYSPRGKFIKDYDNIISAFYDSYNNDRRVLECMNIVETNNIVHVSMVERQK